MNNESMVYLNKVFSDLRIGSCPLMSELTATSASFDQQLTFFEPADHDCQCGGNCNCGDCCKCCCCKCGSSAVPLDLDDDLNFVIDSTEVIITDFDLENPSCLRTCNVTVDGIPVDDLEVFNERYMAGTNELMSRVGDCACMERGLPTKTFFLISGAGSWEARMSIIVRGSVFGCGACRRFKLVMNTRSGVFIDIPGTSTFATSELCLPCTTGGIAPVINFSFLAKATLLNPTLVINAGDSCSVTLRGCLITEPAADVQVTRQTLFRTDAQSVNIPCDDLERCRQAPGTCENGEDDDSNAFQLRNRCCTNERDGGRDTCEEKEHSCGCGCKEDHHKDKCDNDDRCSDECSARGRERNRRSISCQFNGRNGCSF